MTVSTAERSLASLPEQKHTMSGCAYAQLVSGACPYFTDELETHGLVDDFQHALYSQNHSEALRIVSEVSSY